MDELKWTIYKITNPKGLVYVGKTKDFKSRCADYRTMNCKNQKLLYRSLVKYGYSSHIIEVLDEFTSNNSYANRKEVFWIRSFMSNIYKWPEIKGLNLTNGGDGQSGRKMSDEQKKKLSDYFKANPTRPLLGKKMSQEAKDKVRATRIARGTINLEPKHRPTKEETRLKMSLAAKGRVPHNKGLPMLPHVKEALSKANKGRPAHNRGKKFEGSDDERKEKFGAHNLGNSYNKGRKHPPEYGQRIREARLGKPQEKKWKKILQYSLSGDFIQEIPSVKEAAVLLGKHPTTIKDYIAGRIKKAPFILKFK